MIGHSMRTVCSDCGCSTGRIEERGGQDCVFCTECGKWQYNAPKTETGRAERTVTSVHNGVSPKQRARVLLRDGGRCVVCHRGDRPLHVGHLLSVKDGLNEGMTEFDLNNDENVAAMCDECNLGISRDSLPIRFIVSILRSRIRRSSTNPETPCN
jgi:hypothetical protein